MEKTFAIIKPTAVKEKHAGPIIDMIEAAGFDIEEMQKIIMTQEEAEALYAEHKEKPFFAEMVAGMTASPIIVMVLVKDNAVQAWRDLMGATDSSKAAPGTIRAKFGKGFDNAVHGSDSLENSERERNIFFGCCGSC